MCIDGVICQVQRFCVRVGLTLEVLCPGYVLFLLETNVGVDLMGSPAAASSTPSAAAAAIPVSALALALATTAATTSISVLHSL